jgi:hypothetical protein
MVTDKSLTFVTKSEANIETKKIEWCGAPLLLFLREPSGQNNFRADD